MSNYLDKPRYLAAPPDIEATADDAAPLDSEAKADDAMPPDSEATAYDAAPPDIEASADDATPPDGEATAYDFTVLTDRDTIKRFTEEICNAIHHPATIIDINRIGDKDKDSTNVRFDYEVSYSVMRGSCRLLRHCAGDWICNTCDGFHGAMLKGVKKRDRVEDTIEDIRSRINSEINNTPPFFYNGYKDNKPQVEEHHGRPVMEYSCPVLGYRELLLPFFYDNEAIGALSLGQIMVLDLDDENTVEKITSEFFSQNGNRPAELFKKFLEINDLPKDRASDIKKKIEYAGKPIDPINEYMLMKKVGNDDPNRQGSMMNIDKKKYKKFIKKACKKLDYIEKKLEAGVIKKQEDLFEEIISIARNNYNEQLENSNNSEQIKNERDKYRDLLSNAWVLFDEFVTTIKKQLGFEAYLFGDGVNLKIEESQKKPVYPPPEGGSKREKWEYNLAIAAGKGSDENDIIDSFKHKSIIDGLSKGVNIDKKNCILIVCHEIAVLLHVRELQKNIETYEKMTKILGRSISRIRSYIALCTSNNIKEHHILTLRLNRHEGSRISNLLNDHVQMYFIPDGRRFINLDLIRRKIIIDDVKSIVQLTSYMADNIGLITGTISAAGVEAKIKRFDVFALLYKWRVMFRYILKDRNLDIIVVRKKEENIPFFISPHAEDAPNIIKTHPSLFELLVYNIVDNAVKYAHRGSIIYLNWRKSEDKKHFELEISSFGPKIPKGESIFDLYVRGDTTGFTPVDGDGIGLYVVRRVRELLKLVSVKCECTILDERYYIPLVQWYVNETFYDQKSKKMQEQVSKFLHETPKFDWTDVINANEYTTIDRKRDLSRKYLNKRIEKGTWLTKFTVTVPIHMQ